MKRDFLRNLNIDDELINQILDENMKDIGKERAKVSEIQARLDTATEQLETLQKASTDNSTLTKQLEELQAKYDTDTANYQKQLEERAYEDAVNSAISGVQFSSKAAERAFKAELKASGKELKDGKIDGFEDFLKSQRESDPDAFKQENQPVILTKGKTSETPPTNENVGAKYAKAYSSKFTKSNKE